MIATNFGVCPFAWHSWLVDHHKRSSARSATIHDHIWGGRDQPHELVVSSGNRSRPAEHPFQPRCPLGRNQSRSRVLASMAIDSRSGSSRERHVRAVPGEAREDPGQRLQHAVSDAPAWSCAHGPSVTCLAAFQCAAACWPVHELVANIQHLLCCISHSQSSRCLQGPKYFSACMTSAISVRAVHVLLARSRFLQRHSDESRCGGLVLPLAMTPSLTNQVSIPQMLTRPLSAPQVVGCSRAVADAAAEAGQPRGARAADVALDAAPGRGHAVPAEGLPRGIAVLGASRPCGPMRAPSAAYCSGHSSPEPCS